MTWHLSGKPYEVQSTALEKCGERRGFGYFMEMGLGKTAVVLAEFKKFLVEDKADILIILCPSSIKRNWNQELTKWETGLKGAEWPVGKKFNEKETPVIIINYEAFSGGACVGLDFSMDLAKRYRVMLVLDESVQVKNHKSKRTVNLLSLAPFCSYVRVLSGAPIIQGPHDVYAQLRMIGAIKGWNYYAFRNRFCKMGGFGGKQILGARNEEELNGILTEWGFIAKKKDWTDLPAKLPPVNRFIEMCPEQKRAYSEMQKEFVTYINGEYIEASIVITQLLKLQQISSGFIINEDKEVIELTPRPPKLLAIEELMEELQGKLLVFTHFRCTTSQLRDKLWDKYKPAIMLGGMTDDELDAEKRRFAEDPECRIFVIQTQTGKYGHTLLGDQESFTGGDDDNRCYTSLFYENSYSLDNRLQAEDRNHRHGQTMPVSYFDFISSPVELAAITALQRKEDVANSVIEYAREK